MLRTDFKALAQKLPTFSSLFLPFLSSPNQRDIKKEWTLTIIMSKRGYLWLFFRYLNRCFQPSSKFSLLAHNQHLGGLCKLESQKFWSVFCVAMTIENCKTKKNKERIKYNNSINRTETKTYLTCKIFNKNFLFCHFQNLNYQTK